MGEREVRKWLSWFFAFSTKKWTRTSIPKTVTLSITLTERQYAELTKLVEGGEDA